MERPANLKKKPSTRKPVVNCTMEPEDVERLEMACQELHTSKGLLVRAIVLDWLDANTKGKV